MQWIYPQFHFNPIYLAAHQVHDALAMLEKESLEFVDCLEGFHFLEYQMRFVNVDEQLER